MRKYISDNPGSVKLSTKKLKKLRPDHFQWFFRVLDVVFSVVFRKKTFIREVAYCLAKSDTDTAVVVSTSPLLIATYSSVFDAVAMYQFPEWLVEEYQLVPGTRLTSINSYIDTNIEVRDDLDVSPDYDNVFDDFVPLIGEFLSDDMKRLEQHKQSFTEEHWQHVEALALKYRQDHPTTWRDGRPFIEHYGDLDEEVENENEN